MGTFLRCLGQALVAQGIRGLMGLAPFGEQIYDVATDAIQRYREAQREQQMGADLQALLQADREQVRAEARRVAEDVATGRPEAEIRQVEAYLSQVPGVVRQSLRRPADPSGNTVPASLDLRDPIQLASVLPRRAPRFQLGDAVPHAPQWRFVELLGSGGFGEVWLAQNGRLRRAFKFCLDTAARERLLNHERQVIERVMAANDAVKGDDHGIVPLVDAYLKGDPPWLAYEYVEGGDLSGLVRHMQQAAPAKRASQALNVVRVLARVVGRFHRLPQPIIHRDLKPANVLLRRDGFRVLLRITDFGVSQVAAGRGLEQATISTPKMSLGETYRGAHTPIYAPPQQKRGQEADVRDDVYALGIIGYQLLLGDLSAERPAGKWRRRVADCALADSVLDLLESCWDDDPDERPGDAQALAEGLAQPVVQLATPSPAVATPPSPVIRPRKEENGVPARKRGTCPFGFR